jgi:cell division protein FtsA
MNGVVAAPLASALASLEDDEMDLGCICIDMGAGSTSAAVFSGGSLVHVDSLAVGGSHVTADVARGLSTSIAGAERIKTLHGSAIASANEDRETIEAPPRGDDAGAGPIVVPRSILKNVIAPRVEETLELLRERLKASEAPIEPGAGVVLTGGASQLAGVRELAVRVFDRPVRLGRPRRTPHVADAASGPAFGAASGVLLRAAFGPREAVAPHRLASAVRVSPRDAAARPGGNVITRVAGWLSENL